MLHSSPIRTASYLFFSFCLVVAASGIGVIVAMPITTTTTTTTTGTSHSTSSKLDDARAFLAYVSADVVLSDPYVVGSNNKWLAVTRSVRDIDQAKRRRYLYHVPLIAAIPSPTCFPPTELPDTILARIPSPGGNLVAIFREEVIPKVTERRQVLEIWSATGAMSQRIALSESVHGKLIFDGTGFGVPSWNPSETAIAYVAERKGPSTVSFFEDDYSKNIVTNNEGSTDHTHSSHRRDDREEDIRGAQNTLGLGKTEKWGEKYHGHSALLDIFVVHVRTGRIEKLCNCPGHDASTTTTTTTTTEGSYTLGQPIFSPDGNSIVYVAWDAGGGTDMPRRLGLIYCQQRPSKLYVSPITQLMKRIGSDDSGGGSTTEDTTTIDGDKTATDGAPICLTLDSRLSRSPRFSPTDENGINKLVFLCSDRGFDTHSGCMGLQVVDWKEGTPVPRSRRVLVKEVWDPNTDSPALSGSVMGMLFPGLFLQTLPDSPFLSSEYLLTTTQWGSSSRMVRISLKTGELKVIHTGNDGHYSDKVLCASLEGGVVFQTSAPNRIPTLTHIPASALYESTTLMEEDKLALPPMLPIAASKFSAVPESPTLDFNCDIQLLTELPQVDGVKVEGIPVHTILLMPDLSKHPNPPLIVVPHGGPHSVSSTNYVPSLAYLCAHGGYAVALVNYRGSTGFGQGLVESLPTRIGKLDVEDMVAATIKIRDSGLVDPNRIGICGGSHGGFLTGHCTGQYPDLFRVAAMRNPVVNIPSMTTATDIPDWCFIEATGTYDWQDYRPPTPDELQIMWEKSPIRYIQNVKAPTLVALGLKDLRVPPSQGLEWFYTLRARRVSTKLITYDDDDHAIAGVQAESDHWINIKRWFDEHL